MCKLFTLLLLVLAAASVRAQSVQALLHPDRPVPLNTRWTDPDDRSQHLLGAAGRSALEQNPFCDWFGYQYYAYTPDFAGLDTDALRTALQSAEALVFMGTWCGDSQREVPRLYKVLDALGMPPERIRVIALDYKKQGPMGEHAQQHVHHVPAIVLVKDGRELGRITESPQFSLEADLAQILSGQPYAPKYIFSELLAPYIEAGPAALSAALPKLMAQHRYKVRHVYELNTYANVLLNDGKDDLALMLLNTNTQLFPNEPLVYDRLASYYERHSDKEKAVNCLQQGIKLAADRSQRLQQRLQELAGK
jgi:thiol-disulfide isomerase/thioredoxin